jgi:hypothetical protein
MTVTPSGSGSVHLPPPASGRRDRGNQEISSGKI